jgi:hypothetical protein
VAETLNKKQIRLAFREACISGSELPDELAEIGASKDVVKHNPGFVSRICRLCECEISPDEFEVGFTYWNHVMVPYHKDCLKDGSSAESWYAQEIDSDCNDCKHFQRDGIRVTKWSSSGKCLKLDKPTTAFSNFCSGHACFEHRRPEPDIVQLIINRKKR